MRVQTFAPTPALARFVRAFTVVEADADTTRTLIPDASVVLGFRYGGFACDMSAGSARLPSATLAGLRRSARQMFTSAGGGAVLAAFRDSGASVFFDEPLHELFGRTADLGEIVAASMIDCVRAELAHAANSAQRVAIIESFLLGRQRMPPGDAVVAAAVSAIARTDGRLRISELAMRHGMSRDRFEKRFRRAVGTSPKRYASLLRLNRAVALYRQGAPLVALSVDAGYFDQAHFTREFRGYTGQPPGQFFRDTLHC